MNLDRPRHLQGALEWRRPKDQRVVALFDTALVHRTPGNQPGIAAGTATVAGDAVRGVVVEPARGFLAGPAGGLPESKRMVWWVQAEALLGFLNANQVTQRPAYWEAFQLQARSTLDNFLARRFGEWYKTIMTTGKITGEKSREWKAPYHAARSCLEVLRRLGESH